MNFEFTTSGSAGRNRLHFRFNSKLIIGDFSTESKNWLLSCVKGP